MKILKFEARKLPWHTEQYVSVHSGNWCGFLITKLQQWGSVENSALPVRGVPGHEFISGARKCMNVRRLEL
jgi:hypothetical protein